jgi:MinD-like ATPase involved in chromosome partitioning or flagellar assembly
LANHEQDHTAGAAPVAPGSDGDGRSEISVPPANCPYGLGEADEGTFRWPSTGLPRLFGQPASEPEPEGDPSGPLLTPAGESDSGMPPPVPGAGQWAGGGEPPDAAGAADAFADTEVYQQADGFGPADAFPGEGAYSRADVYQADVYQQADGRAPEPGYGVAPGPGPAGEYDPPDDYPLAEYGPADVAGQVAGPLPLPDEEPPHWQRPETAESLTADLLLPGRHPLPPSGWRRVVYQATGGLVRPQESAAERRRRELAVRACTPVATGHHRVAVLSLKGGVGKTTTVMGLGSTLSSLRGDRVIAVDANPDRGTLSDKLRLETAATIRDLLNERDQILRYADIRAFTTQAPSRLEVLASDRDPTVSVAFSDRDYEDVTQVLEHYYSVCITDCGTGLLHSAMGGVLRLADQIVLVSSPSVDGARSASATLDWLQAHGYGDLVRDGVVVLSVIRPRSKSTVDLGRLEQHFATRCRAVVRVPYDAHLEEGAEVNLDQLSRATADAYLALAAEVGDGFNWPHRAEEIG